MSTDNLGPDLGDLDILLQADMDDLEDLPPVGAPPSGHYNLIVSFSIEETGEEKRPTICATYIVDTINELKDPEEASDVAVGQEFKEFFFLKKKDGSQNRFGIGNLKARLRPHAEASGTSNVGELIQLVKQSKIACSIKRTVNKKDEDRFNIQLKDIVLL